MKRTALILLGVLAAGCANLPSPASAYYLEEEAFLPGPPVGLVEPLAEPEIEVERVVRPPLVERVIETETYEDRPVLRRRTYHRHAYATPRRVRRPVAIARERVVVERPARLTRQGCGSRAGHRA